MPTIDDVLSLIEERSGLNLDESGNRDKVNEFIDWQTFELHPEYNLNEDENIKDVLYDGRNGPVLADKVTLFLYIVGEISIIVDNKETKKTIQSVEDLHLLSDRSIGWGNYYKNKLDEKLSKLRGRLLSRNHRWKDYIDEIGSYVDVIGYFGRQITFVDVQPNLRDKKIRYILPQFSI